MRQKERIPAGGHQRGSKILHNFIHVNYISQPGNQFNNSLGAGGGEYGLS